MNRNALIPHFLEGFTLQVDRIRLTCSCKRSGNYEVLKHKQTYKSAKFAHTYAQTSQRPQRAGAMFEAIAAQVKNQQLINEFEGINVDLSAFAVWKDLQRFGNMHDIEEKLTAMADKLERENKMALNYLYKEQPLSRLFIKEYVLKNQSLKQQQEIVDAFRMKSPELFKQYLICKVLEEEYRASAITKVLDCAYILQSSCSMCASETTGKLRGAAYIGSRRLR